MQITSNVTSGPKAPAACDIRVHAPVKWVGPEIRAACGHRSLGQCQDGIGLSPALVHPGPQFMPRQKRQEKILKRQHWPQNDHNFSPKLLLSQLGKFKLSNISRNGGSRAQLRLKFGRNKEKLHLNTPEYQGTRTSFRYARLKAWE